MKLSRVCAERAVLFSPWGERGQGCECSSPKIVLKVPSALDAPTVLDGVVVVEVTTSPTQSWPSSNRPPGLTVRVLGTTLLTVEDSWYINSANATNFPTTCRNMSTKQVNLEFPQPCTGKSHFLLSSTQASSALLSSPINNIP